jgi:hypothetical protein
MATFIRNISGSGQSGQNDSDADHANRRSDEDIPSSHPAHDGVSAQTMFPLGRRASTRADVLSGLQT